MVNETTPGGVLEPVKGPLLLADERVALGHEPRPVLDVPRTRQEVLAYTTHRLRLPAVERELQEQTQSSGDRRDRLVWRGVQHRSRVLHPIVLNQRNGQVPP